MTTSAKVRMVATARQQYVGRSLRIGDQFEADEQDAADLETMRFATRVKVEHVAPETTVAVKAIEAEEAEEAEQVEAKDKPVGTGRYKRRDLRASK